MTTAKGAKGPENQKPNEIGQWDWPGAPNPLFVFKPNSLRVHLGGGWEGASMEMHLPL